jgi:hypothetical protein
LNTNDPVLLDVICTPAPSRQGLTDVTPLDALPRHSIRWTSERLRTAPEMDDE